MWKDLYVDGDIGSEGGEVIYDEEYCNSCRITLEKCERYYAVTCGVYGSMVHTTFFNAANYQAKYESMKKELQDFIDSDLSQEEVFAFYREFTAKY